MMKIALIIAYDGTAYSGWQRQADTSATVQEKLETAIASVADHDISVICAGRTDAGVHATGQVVHFETSADRSTRSWIRGINTHLPSDINVRLAKQVDDGFHARFSAMRRCYSYIIDNSRLSPLAVNRLGTTWIYEPLNIDMMHTASRCLLGEHDFSAYRSSVCQAKSALKTIYQLDIERRGEYVILQIEANAFLHHMVRNIAGVLTAIGSGQQPEAWCKEVLDAGDRTLGGVTAKASGLYLTGVGYPEKFGMKVLDTQIMMVT